MTFYGVVMILWYSHGNFL